MQTKDYTTDLLPLIKSLCGVEFANLELPRIKAMVNSRAKRAYRASNFWPRFLVVGEERDVTNGYVPWTQAGLDSVDTFVIIHRSAPYIADSAQNFDFYVDFTGAKILQVLFKAMTYNVALTLGSKMNSRGGISNSNGEAVPTFTLF